MGQIFYRKEGGKEGRKEENEVGRGIYGRFFFFLIFYLSLDT